MEICGRGGRMLAARIGQKNGMTKEGKNGVIPIDKESPIQAGCEARTSGSVRGAEKQFSAPTRHGAAVVRHGLSNRSWLGRYHLGIRLVQDGPNGNVATARKRSGDQPTNGRQDKSAALGRGACGWSACVNLLALEAPLLALSAERPRLSTNRAPSPIRNFDARCEKR
jgi:hypothetical protein